MRPLETKEATPRGTHKRPPPGSRFLQEREARVSRAEEEGEVRRVCGAWGSGFSPCLGGPREGGWPGTPRPWAGYSLRARIGYTSSMSWTLHFEEIPGPGPVKLQICACSSAARTAS